MSFLSKYPKLKTPLLVLGIYILLGLVTFSIVNETDQVKVSDKEQRVPDDDAEIHPARTYLIIDDGISTKDYYARLDTTDNFKTVLEYHRENSNLSYELIGYTYGTALDNINGYEAPDGFVWKVYDEEEEITYAINDVKLQHEHT